MRWINDFGRAGLRHARVRTEASFCVRRAFHMPFMYPVFRIKGVAFLESGTPSPDYNCENESV